MDHFRAYARNLVLDSGDTWEPEDFQLEVVEDLFGGVSEVWLVIPEGNGKTTALSGIVLYHGDYTPDAAVVIGASSRDQCQILHDQAAGFVRRTPGLEKRFRVFDGYRRIKCLRTSGRIQVFAADDRTGDGVIPSFAALDELHRHKDLRLYRTWRGKLEKRGGQLAAISTAGEPDSEFEQIRQQLRSEAQHVQRDGCHVRAERGGMVLHDYAVPSDGDCEDMAQVKAANPLSTITEETLGRKRSSPSMSLAHFRRFVCNQAVKGAASAIDESEWEAAGTDERIPPGQTVWVGVDFGWKWDCTAIVPLWMKSREERLLGVPEILTPPRDGTNMHPDRVKDAFRRIHKRNPIEMAVVDPDRAEEIGAWLEDELGVEVSEYGQSNGPQALAYERWMEALREGWLKHPRDPEFTRHALNATERILPDGRSKFDRASTSRDPSLQDRRVWDALDAASSVHAASVGHMQAAVDPAAYRIERL